jgi:hypothetical protein
MNQTTKTKSAKGSPMLRGWNLRGRGKAKGPLKLDDLKDPKISQTLSSYGFKGRAASQCTQQRSVNSSS